MSGDIFKSIREDLQIIHNYIKSQLSIKAGHVGKYAHLEFSPMDNFIRPAIVLAVAKLYNCRTKEVISLGAIMQFIFMASQIHKKIPESSFTEHLGDPRDGNQFPVLVGDYLYGKFFTTLCDANIVKYLHPLAEIIAKIHEGGILSKESENQPEEYNQLVEKIVRLETAELFGGAARITGDYAGASDEEKRWLYEYGINIGMVYGLLQKNCSNITSSKYIERAIEALDKLPGQPAIVMLENLVHKIRLAGEEVRKVV